MGEKLKQPECEATAYHCPLCGAYAAQEWHQVHGMRKGNFIAINEVKISICTHCKKPAIWNNSRMVYPSVMMVPPPNPDLDTDIQNDYKEAADIVNRSPRAAAALLRLCVQKLCKQLGLRGEKIDDDIAALVKEGLHETIQQALDVLRVVGNNAVHPGQIDLRDNKALATKLFDLLNLIAETQVTQPKRVKALYEDLPQGAKDRIEKRDRK